MGLLGLIVGAAPAQARQAIDQASAYDQTNLVSDIPGAAQVTDANLINAWGMSAGPATPVWVSDNGADVSTLYAGAQPGTPVTVVPLVVSIPGGAPTGQAFNDTSGFVLNSGGKTGPARFIFAGEDGDITAWNPTGVVTSAVLTAHTEDAVYKGLALLHAGPGPLLLAADFRHNRIDVFDTDFHLVRQPHRFASIGVPPGYAPFNVAVLGNLVFVTYALQDEDREDEGPGAGHGFINVFDRDGKFVGHFARRGVLNSPWGLAIAPQGFGSFSGDLLVGNFGDGRINAFSLRSGKLLGTLRHPDATPIEIDGLWGLLPGNPVSGGTDAVWFSAGPDDETHGLLGTLRVAS